MKVKKNINQKNKKIENKQQKTIWINRFLILSLIICGLLSIGQIFICGKTSTYGEKIFQARNTLQELETQEEKLLSLVENQSCLSSIESRAKNELGMISAVTATIHLMPHYLAYLQP